ncbi:MAG: hypothetical protein KME46_07125 [Brasilonema angustatum HA4187-MV1]|jgi:hypothetical protein|nr:hypothetical protein [Brasilonema angustatum HA4187-MV1]
MKKLPFELKPLIIDKLKLIRTSEKENLLGEVYLTEQSCLNDTAWMAFENGKVSSDISLQKYLALLTSEKEVQHKAVSGNDHPLTTVRHKKTPSRKCRLMALSGTAKQFTSHINNHITKEVVIGKNFIKLKKWTWDLRIFPNLTSKKIYNGMVQRIENRAQPCHLSPVFYDHPLEKPKVSQSKWSYAELDGFIHYKVVMNNSSAIRVDADCSSQSYPCGGHTNKDSCPEPWINGSLWWKSWI